MVPVIEFEECLRDSPKFRATLEHEEADIDQLESKLDKILKMCGVMVDVGKTYVAQQTLFANGLWDLSTYFREDPDVMVCLNKLIHAVQEMNKFHTILLDQASRTVLKNLTSFIKTDIKSVKESRQCFHKISTDLDGVLSRNSQVQKSKPADSEDTQNLLLATRTAFRHTALDYVHTISLVQAKKRHEVLGTLLSYMHACNTFFHQGTDLCQDLDPFFKTLADKVVSMRQECVQLEKAMENRHSYVNNLDVVASSNGKMEGYLFKRTSNAFKTWNRRWFSLQNSQLVYRKRTGEDSVTVMEDDLRLCTVKTVNDGDRRFCFEVLSPSKSHVLQADSEEMFTKWVAAMQSGIGAAFNKSMSTGEDCRENRDSVRESSVRTTGIAEALDKKPRILEQLLKLPGNDSCCDCGASDPRWASINLGVTLCIECSGVHRSLGVHQSKVRSLTLDAWEPEIVKVMAELGNDVVNKVYEADVPADFQRATPKCSGEVRKAWITAKYQTRQFVRPLTASSASPGPRSRAGAARKWSVRRLRRRATSGDKRGTRMPPLDEDTKRPITQTESKDSETTQTKRPLARLSQLPVAGSTEASTTEAPTTEAPTTEAPTTEVSTTEDNGNVEVLVFGTQLEVRPAEISVELSSDQDDSTGGEEEEECTAAEDMANLRPDLLLYKAAAAHNLPVMCKAFALGADKLWVNADDRSRSPLHTAITSGSSMAVEYLLLNGAKINAQDGDGKTPLHMATELGNTGQVCLLLKHRAEQHLVDSEGRTPLDVAVRDANADIVTLLRLALLDEQMKASEHGSGGDGTFNDVVRDFSQLACSHPERLVRSKPERGGEGD